MTERELRQANCTYDHSGFICMKCGYVAPPAAPREGLELHSSREPWYAVYVLGSIPADEPVAIFEYGDMAKQFGMLNYCERFRIETINWHKATAPQAKGEGE